MDPNGSMDPWLGTPAVNEISRKLADSIVQNRTCSIGRQNRPILAWRTTDFCWPILLGNADLHLLSPQPDTGLHCQTTDTGLVHRAVYLFTSEPSLVLIAPTHGGMARLS